DVAEKDLGDLAVRAADFDRRLAERLGAAQVVYLASDASPVFGDHLDVIAVEHSLQVLHHSKKIFHHPILLTDRALTNDLQSAEQPQSCLGQAALEVTPAA